MKKTLLILFILVFTITIFSSVDADIVKKENYIILTSKNLLPSAELFYNLRKSDYNVSIVTTEEIGSAVPSAIRTYLRDHFCSGYLLIIGSENAIPRPNMYPSSANHLLINPPGQTETDFYYSLLNENIDKDGDGYPGELFDDRMTLDTDLIVGRIPFDDNVEISNVFQNQVDFENNPPPKAVLAASFISFPGESYRGAEIYSGDGARFEELIKNIIPCETITMYEKEGSFPSVFNCNLPLNKDNFYDAITDAGFVSWDSHGSGSAAFNYSWVDMNKNGIPDDGFKYEAFITKDDDFTADGIFFSGSCLNENGIDNLGKAILLKGGTIFIGSTEVSFTPSYFSAPDDGGTESIQYYFVKNLIQGNTVGRSLYSSFKYYFKNLLSNDVEDPVEGSFMNIYDLNIYGDPAVIYKLKTTQTEKTSFNIPKINVPIAFSGGKNFEIQVNFANLTDAFIVLPRHVFSVNSVSSKGAIIDNEFGLIRLNEVQGSITIKGIVRGSVDKGIIKVLNSVGENSLSVDANGFSINDVNFDGSVNLSDLRSIINSFGKTYMNEGFNSSCDLNFDHKVNGLDVLRFLFPI